MSHHQKNINLVFISLFFIQLFFMNLPCYATDLNCTCATGSLCSRCIEDLSFYCSSAALEPINLEGKIASIKYDADIEPCDKCEENSTTLYKMKKKKLCPRCALEYLSFYFPTKTIEEIKLNCENIIFDVINDNGVVQKTTKVVINTLVEKIFYKELKILEKRKTQNKNCDLFLIVNEILNKLLEKKIKLKRRKCETCSEERFHLIKIPCCQNLICIQCILEEVLMRKIPKCVMCQNTYISRNTQDFEETFKSIAIAIWQKCSVEINPEQELELQNMLIKMRNPKASISKKYKQLGDVIQKNFGTAIEMLTQKEVLDLEKEVGKRRTFKWHCMGSILTVVPQYILCANIDGDEFNHYSACVWIVGNSLMASYYSLAACQNSITKSFPNKLHEIVNKTVKEINKFSLTWFNFLIWYFIFGSHFYEHRSFLLLIFVLKKPILWFSLWLTNYMHYSAIKETLFEFY